MWKVQGKHKPAYAVGGERRWINYDIKFATKREAEANAALARRKGGKTYDYRVVKA